MTREEFLKLPKVMALEQASHRIAAKFMRTIAADGDITERDAAKIIEDELKCSREEARDFVKRLNNSLVAGNN